MARIRSVHPTLFTDEAWVSCSPLARVLYIGLMTDADDQGLFEWKPLQIRMRLLPGDDANVPALLEELAAANLIAPLESGGKKLGAVRKFRRFQRPKKPNALFVLPSQWRTYVGLSPDGSELAEDEDPPGSEPKPPESSPVTPKSELGAQMEDGGGRREEIHSEPNGSGAEAPDDEDLKAKAWRLALRVLMDRGMQTRASAAKIVGKWAREYALEHIAQASQAAWDVKTLDPISYVTAALDRLRSETTEADALLLPTETRQRFWMQDFRDRPQQWREHERGPRPGEPGCRVTPELQREFGVDPAKPQPVGRSAA